MDGQGARNPADSVLRIRAKVGRQTAPGSSVIGCGGCLTASGGIASEFGEPKIRVS